MQDQTFITKILKFNTKPSFGNTVVCNIPRHADLFINAYLQITLEDENCPYMGELFIDHISVSIGGSVIYKNDYNFIHIYNMLYNTDEKRKMIRNLMGSQGSKIRIIPLNSIFKNMEHILHLISLDYHLVSISIKFNDCSYTEIENAVILGEYKNLDTNEKSIYIEPHKHLIEQVQTQRQVIDIDEYNQIQFVNKLKEKKNLSFSEDDHISDSIFNNFDIRDKILSFKKDELNNIKLQIPLNFSFSCKELYWIIKPLGNNFDYSDVIQYATLEINGNNLFEKQNREYFTKLQHFKHHTNTAQNVYVYSFTINPEDYVSSKSFNMSLVDRVILKIELDKNKIKHSNYELIVYATNYNSLIYNSGMGAIAYSH